MKRQLTSPKSGRMETYRCVSLRYYSGIRLEGLMKTTKHLSGYPVIRLRFEPLNPGPPEYEAGVLTIGSRRSKVVREVRFHDTRDAENIFRIETCVERKHALFIVMLELNVTVDKICSHLNFITI
jgi:hypothetical protein